MLLVFGRKLVTLLVSMQKRLGSALKVVNFLVLPHPPLFSDPMAAYLAKKQSKQVRPTVSAHLVQEESGPKLKDNFRKEIEGEKFDRLEGSQRSPVLVLIYLRL